MYLNDVGLLTYLLYSNNINAILQDKKSINLGSVYETVVAQELNSHGFKMNYYDNKSIGEVDFLIDDYRNLTVLPPWRSNQARITRYIEHWTASSA